MIDIPCVRRISVGNTHLKTSTDTVIDTVALAAIEEVVNCPLVLHGASGISAKDRLWLASNTKVCKFNVGTELRQAFGSALRDVLLRDSHLFDRNQIFSAVQPALIKHTKSVLKSISIGAHEQV